MPLPHGSAPCYLQQTVCPVASMESRRRLAAVSHIIRPDGACYTKVNTGWPCLRCSRTTGLEQPSGRHQSLSVIGNFQTFTQVPPFSAVFLLTLSFLVFVWLWLCTAPLKWLRYLRHSRNWLFYITNVFRISRSDRTYFNSASSSDRLLILQVYSGQQSLNFLASFTSGR